MLDHILTGTCKYCLHTVFTCSCTVCFNVNDIVMTLSVSASLPPKNNTKRLAATVNYPSDLIMIYFMHEDFGLFFFPVDRCYTNPDMFVKNPKGFPEVTVFYGGQKDVA